MTPKPIHIGTEPQHILTFRRLTYKPWTALGEFIDNSTSSYDANRPVLDKAFADDGVDSLVVKVVYGTDQDGDTLRIRDNAMGMSHDELRKALRIGMPPATDQYRSKYGMGMKTAACWFGDKWTVTTSKLGETGGHQIEVDVARIALGDDDLRYRFLPDYKTSDHFTIIEISPLRQTIRKRTLSKVKEWLSSMYRLDLSGPADPTQGKPSMRLFYNENQIEAFSVKDENLLLDPSQKSYKKEFSFNLGALEKGKDRLVSGWVGILSHGGRPKAGFSVFSSGRMVRGYPEAWRPSGLFGQTQGSNDLVNQRLVGEITLTNFVETMTKDDINWNGDEEDRVSDLITEFALDYKKIAQQYRSTMDDERGPSALDEKVALEALEDELNSTEFKETIASSGIIPDQGLLEKEQELLRKKLEEVQKFDVIVDVTDFKAHVKINGELTPTEPYMVWRQSADGKNFYVSMNMHHPIRESFEGSSDLLLFLRLCAYEAVAEYLAGRDLERVRPEVVRQIKSKLMSVRHNMDQSHGEEKSA